MRILGDRQRHLNREKCGTSHGFFVPSPGLAAEYVSQDVQVCAGAVLLSVSAICQDRSSASITGAVPSRNALRAFLLGALLWLPSCAPAFANSLDVAVRPSTDRRGERHAYGVCYRLQQPSTLLSDHSA